MEDLAKKIIADKLNEKLIWMNKGARSFDCRLDVVSFSLTPKQFNVIKKSYKLKCIQVLCSGLQIDKFLFGDFTISTKYNNRMDCYELLAKHKDYIEDYDERLDYFESEY